MTSSVTGPTLGGSDGECARVARLLDDVDDVLVVHAHDVHVVDGQDPVAHVQLSAALRRRTVDDPT